MPAMRYLGFGHCDRPHRPAHRPAVAQAHRTAVAPAVASTYRSALAPALRTAHNSAITATFRTTQLATHGATDPKAYSRANTDRDFECRAYDIHRL